MVDASHLENDFIEEYLLQLLLLLRPRVLGVSSAIKGGPRIVRFGNRKLRGSLKSA